MHRIIEKDDTINLEEDNNITINGCGDIVIYIKGSGKVVFNVNGKCNLVLYHLGVNISNNIIININNSFSSVTYYYSVINYDSNYMNMVVNHNSNNTSSYVYNHGVNVYSNKLKFDVNGVIGKDIVKCVCNQENRILNINDGDSEICPNLLIDSYDNSCSHSAYISKFSDDIMFYLMSRGLDYLSSYDLLIKGFLIPNGVIYDKINYFTCELDVKKWR